MVSNGLQFSENKLERRLGQRYNSGRSEKGGPDSREMAYSQIDKNSIMIWFKQGVASEVSIEIDGGVEVSA